MPDINDNSYRWQCPDCLTINLVEAINAFRPAYEIRQCWVCRSAFEVETTSGKVVTANA